jgi:nucleotide-binding universal stress UspA family protein
VVARDGHENAERLLAVAAAWALHLETALRIVTVYEPVPPDLGRAQHYPSEIGPPGDPEVYLAAMRERVADVGLARVDTEAIEHPISAGRGLEEHLGRAPAALLVLGNRQRPHSAPTGGVVDHTLRNVTCPLLLVGAAANSRGHAH